VEGKDLSLNAGIISGRTSYHCGEKHRKPKTYYLQDCKIASIVVHVGGANKHNFRSDNSS
jgi:hypothetical protein